MIGADVFAVDAWSIPERELHLDLLGQTESIFALSNGHIGLRGNLEEGEPSFTPGTFLNSFYEIRPLPYAESAYGNPEAGQTLINVTDGKVIRLLVDDEPFDVRYGKLVGPPAAPGVLPARMPHADARKTRRDTAGTRPTSRPTASRPVRRIRHSKSRRLSRRTRADPPNCE